MNGTGIPFQPVLPPAYNEDQLRDYFAGQALAGIIATCTTKAAAEKLIEACWVAADAMIDERRRRQGGPQ